MSYILDALKRADDERRLGRVPDFDSLSVSGAETRTISAWPWLVGIALLLNLLALGALYLVMQPTSAEQSRSRSLPTPRVEATAMTAQGAAVRRDATVSEPPVEVVEPLPPTETNSAPEPVTIRVENAEPDPVAKPRPILPAFSDTRDPVENFSDLPDEFVDSLPEMPIDAHVYNQQPSRRFVMIDMNRYREGERVPNGPTIEKIRRDGIVMRYRGRRFLLPLRRG